jgi:hypothetical protein
VNTPRAAAYAHLRLIRAARGHRTKNDEGQAEHDITARKLLLRPRLLDAAASENIAFRANGREWLAFPQGRAYARSVDLTHLLLFVLAPLVFIGLQWLFSAWYGGYRSVVDFYYHCINKRPGAGAWYYGSKEAARSRGGSVTWDLERKIRRD